ncbi:hypothetical protein U9M48_033722 [Paspalum notatum var. saurae]|uniref:KIB1-4 beta-propeller domain-containing protein n=1 Tax=Paspalum notatum var. saurae TaxID=547442 RepID=A0AAQ3UB92_PASNO
MAAAGWASLPADLLREISGHLSADGDHLRIHQVCAHWHASTPLPAVRPCVVASRPWPWKHRYPVGLYSMWHVKGGQRVSGFPDPPAGLPWCCGMSRGWLALSNYAKWPTRLLLWDPGSGAEVPLPLPPRPSILQVFLAEDPLASPHWMALATLEDRGSLLFWRPGDESWRPVTGGCGMGVSPSVDSIAFHDGKMFFNVSSDRLLAYNLNLGTTSPPTFVGEVYVDAAVRAVACNGDLLVVALDDETLYPSFAEVYRIVDWAPAGRRRLQLGSRVTDLGGYSLFLGRGDTLALRAGDVLGIKGNHVYVLAQQLVNLPWLFTFDLKSGVRKEYRCEENQRVEARNYLWPYTWFCLKAPFFKRKRSALAPAVQSERKKRTRVSVST